MHLQQGREKQCDRSGPCRQLAGPLKSSVVSHPRRRLYLATISAPRSQRDSGKRRRGQLCEGWSLACEGGTCLSRRTSAYDKDRAGEMPQAGNIHISCFPIWPFQSNKDKMSYSATCAASLEEGETPWTRFWPFPLVKILTRFCWESVFKHRCGPTKHLSDHLSTFWSLSDLWSYWIQSRGVTWEKVVGDSILHKRRGRSGGRVGFSDGVLWAEIRRATRACRATRRALLTFFPSPYISGNFRSSSSMVL